MSSLECDFGHKETCCDKLCCKDRCLPVDKSTVFFIQALIVWMALSLPGNIVTLVMYKRVSAADKQESAFYLQGDLVEVNGFPDMPAALDTICPYTNRHQLRSQISTSFALCDQKCDHTCGDRECDHAKCVLKCRTQKLDGVKCLGMLQEVFSNSSKVFEAICHSDLVDISINAIASCIWKAEKNALQGPLWRGSDVDVNETSRFEESWDCAEKFEDYRFVTEGAQFWLEGVILLAVGVVGMGANVLSIVVLSRIGSNTTFNRLLMTLAIVDILLLFYYVLDFGIVGTFFRSVKGRLEPHWYRISFPYLHPFKYFCISASIYMVVAISAERHRAICSPLTHRPTFWPYVVMVFLVSGATNIPKFFEFRLQTENNFTDYWTTALNEDPAYITFSSWWDELIIIGIVPLLALVIFNSRIYLKLRASDSKQKYRFVGKRRNLQTKPSNPFHESESRFIEAPTFNRTDPFAKSAPSSRLKDSLSSDSNRIKPNNHVTVEINMDCKNESAPLERFGESAQQPETTVAKNGGVVESLEPTFSFDQTGPTSPTVVPRTTSNNGSSQNYNQIRPQQHDQHLELQKPAQQHFRKRREKSAMILVSIVLTFLFCQTFRLVIQAYEVLHPSHSTPDLYEFCRSKGRFHVPVAFYVMLCASNLLIVINSSINFLIYCCVGKSFRSELKALFGRRQ